MVLAVLPAYVITVNPSCAWIVGAVPSGLRLFLRAPQSAAFRMLLLGFCPRRVDAEIPDVGVDFFADHFNERVFAWF